MRIAVISDIHGNLPALDEVLADIQERGVDVTVNLGDICASPLWPRETFERLEALELPTVRGNHDRWVTELPREKLSRTTGYEFDQLLPAQRQALGALPASVSLDNGNVLAVHGTPSSDETFLLEERVDSRMYLSTPAQIKERLGPVVASLVLCGHSHTQQLVQIPGGPVIVNPGSVGLPNYADGPDARGANARSPHARYAVATRRKGRWSVELLALAYDWDRAARRALDNDRPDWARVYATGSVLEPGEMP